jgi:hypothetical protein
MGHRTLLTNVSHSELGGDTLYLHPSWTLQDIPGSQTCELVVSDPVTWHVQAKSATMWFGHIGGGTGTHSPAFVHSIPGSQMREGSAGG